MSQPTASRLRAGPIAKTGVLIIGTGVGGLAMARQVLMDGATDVIVLERADDVGGTWRDNSYPGCACDVPSHVYSYSFRLNPNWSQVHSAQPEILEYIRDMARDEGLYEHIHFNADVSMCHWDDDSATWLVETSRGLYEAPVLITAAGNLADPRLPEIPGIETFAGHLFHSARWDHDIDVTGLRVGMIGSGASAVQIVPEVAKVASHLTVFQRSAPWIRPRNDHVYTAAERRMFARVPAAMKRLRADMYWTGEQLFLEKKMVDRFIDAAERLALDHLHSQVTDPELRRKLTPDYRFGCKRTLRSNDYYPTFNLPHVELDVTGVDRITPTSVLTKDGREHELDVLVCATGFMTGDMPIAQRIRGRDGVLLANHWSNGPSAFAGITVNGFPNLFLMNGPNVTVLASVIFILESQAAYIGGALRHMRENALTRLEPTAEGERAYARDMDRRAVGTVWIDGGCESWYQDKRSGRLTALWPDFARRYLIENGEFSPDGYLTLGADSRAPASAAPGRDDA